MRFTRHSFTLIELLTVIAVIAILAGIMLPAINGAREKAKATKAKTEIKSLQMAIQQYETTYGYLPVAGSSDVAVVGTTYANLIGDLSSASGSTRTNPRNLCFLETQTVNTYKDPWGNDYCVFIDANYDRVINAAVGASSKPFWREHTPYPDHDAASYALKGPWQDVRASVAIWSLGPVVGDKLCNTIPAYSSHDPHPNFWDDGGKSASQGNGHNINSWE